MPSRSPGPPRPVHEPCREACPWCGSNRLRTRLRAPDLRAGRPGTFTLDECRDCAHVFQNPRLTAEGRSLYDEHVPEETASRRRLRATARTMLPFPEPESWLDVGTADAHFPEAAKEVFPYTSFDGLDPTLRVERAREAGRVEEAHVGLLTAPHITDRLHARYDIVSMRHHLARVPDPREELRAALRVLRPGGHLLLELPDPQSTFASLLGKWWHAHGQPRHVHLIPMDNLRVELTSQGCTIVTTDRSGAHVPHDLSRAVSLAVSHTLRTRPTLKRVATYPVAAATASLDHTLSPLLRRTRFSNTYRLIARKE